MLVAALETAWLVEDLEAARLPDDLEVARLGSDLEEERRFLRSTEGALETDRRPADEDPECQRTDEDLD